MSVSKDTAGREAAIAVRNIEFYRPDAQAVPQDLLARGAAGLGATELTAALDPDYLRLASRIEPAAVIGGYAMRRLTERHFELISLAVREGFEHQLLGRRLLGHALGLAESKAGRVVSVAICADNVRALAVLQRYGFVPVSDVLQSEVRSGEGLVSLCFELTPE